MAILKQLGVKMPTMKSALKFAYAQKTSPAVAGLFF